MIPKCGFRFLTAGILWLWISSPVLAADPILYAAVLSNKRYVVGSDNASTGLWVSIDLGKTWQCLSWPNVRASDVAVCPGDSAGTIYMAAGNGVLATRDNGSHWKILTGWEITEVQDIEIHPKNRSLVVIGTAYGVYLSEDKGSTWEDRSEGLETRFCSALQLDRESEDRMWVGTENGVYATMDRARHWKPAGLEVMAVRVLVQDPDDPRFLLAGTEDHGVYWSSDNGSTWNPCGGPMRHATVYDLRFDPRRSSTVYAGTHGKGVFRTFDCGKTWKRLTGMEGTVVHSLAVVDGEETLLFAGTVNEGVTCFSESRGKGRWTAAGLPNAQVWAMEVR